MARQTENGPVATLALVVLTVLGTGCVAVAAAGLLKLLSEVFE